ncbi:NAD-dependent succinate-semialdehyde dehydrogenase [Gemmatimonadota bacterium]
MVSINPATGRQIREYPDFPPERIPEILERASHAQAAWRTVPIDERKAPITALGNLLRERRDELAALMAEEMGKPIREGRAEVEKCAWVCDYAVKNGEDFFAPAPVETGASRSYVAFEPLGVVLGIMPWNFPFWQVIRYAVPALLAGNGTLLKHAPNVPGCALALEALFSEAGFPDDLFKNLLLDVIFTPALIEDPRVAAVTLTGSTRAGSAVAQTAGRSLKKTVLELGGSDPYVFLADADLGEGVLACTAGRLFNTGQSCIAAKRMVVVREILDRFEEALVAEMTARVMGDPTAEETDLGPIARDDLRENLHRQVTESVDAGARLLTGGEIPDGPGFFYPVTVLTEVVPGMPAYHEELFGPVAAILPAADEADALRIANDTVYGLGAAVFTADVEKGERIAREVLQAGSCFVNDFVRSDPRLPFGGIKSSGYGRELSVFGFREFVNIKTVWVK